MSKYDVTSIADSILTAPSPPLQLKRVPPSTSPTTPSSARISSVYAQRRAHPARRREPIATASPTSEARASPKARASSTSEGGNHNSTSTSSEARASSTSEKTNHQSTLKHVFQGARIQSRGGKQSQLNSLHIEAHPPPLGPGRKVGTDDYINPCRAVLLAFG